MRIRFILCFLLFLLASILFSVSNHFFFFLLLQIVEVTMGKNRLNTVHATNSIQQERLPVSLEVGRMYF